MVAEILSRRKTVKVERQPHWPVTAAIAPPPYELQLTASPASKDVQNPYPHVALAMHMQVF
jgi:hypothetical protein